jgi:hypothetical protein
VSRPRYVLLLAALSAALTASAGACGPDEPGATSDAPPGDAGSFDFDAADEPPPLDAAGYCGNRLIETARPRKNLYFVVDRSSSMANQLDGSSLNRFESVRQAIAEVLIDVGYHVAYGGAVFPGPQGGCAPGVEVFPAQPGDSIQFSATSTIGPTLQGFLNALAGELARSGTPLSPTLEALTPTLLGLEGETFVVIATDGHPNCNPEAICGVDDCYYNMLPDWEIAGRPCDDTWNCCASDDPDLRAAGVDGPIQCVDREPTLEAIRQLASAGIRTYVIGLPDSSAFRGLLDEMAVAGGTAQDGETKYFPVGSALELSTQLHRIGADVAVSCELELDEPPPDPEMLNVYLDAQSLPQHETEGWSYRSTTSIEIHGAPCDSLLRGDVLNVQIVAGCPTDVY